jgi:hypothetical protein
VVKSSGAKIYVHVHVVVSARAILLTHPNGGGVAWRIARDTRPRLFESGAFVLFRERPMVSVSASDVMRHGHGICFAKSHLLAAVLRACGIATGLSYQKLADGERTYLHALNAVWLRDQRRWIRLDARGNKPGVDAKFSVGIEYLAFPIRLDLGECDFAEIHARALPSTLAALRSSRTTVELARRLPEDMSAADRRQAEEACFRLEHLWPSFDSITR